MTRTPAEVFPLGEFIADELAARDWTTGDLAARMTGDPAVNELTLDLMTLLAPRKDMLVGMGTIAEVARIFEVPESFLIEIDLAWRMHGERHPAPEPPR